MAQPAAHHHLPRTTTCRGQSPEIDGKDGNVPPWKDAHAPRSRQSLDDGFFLSGSVGLGAGNRPEDVAALPTALVDGGYLAAPRDSLLYDPHDPGFLSAVLLLQE